MGKRVQITKRFECVEDEELGNTGWREEGKSHYNAGDGRLVAHDMLEHFPDDAANVESELMALGALMIVRGTAGFGYHPLGDDLKSDIQRLYEESNMGKYTMKPPTLGMRRRLSTDSYDVQSVLEDTANGLTLYIIRNTSWNDDKPTPAERKEVAQFAKDALPWIRYGYRRARDRYGVRFVGEFLSLFRYIQEEADKQLKWAEPGVGTILVVEVDTAAEQQAKVYVEEPEYPDDE